MDWDRSVRLALVCYCLGIFAGSFVGEIRPFDLYQHPWIASVASFAIASVAVLVAQTCGFSVFPAKAFRIAATGFCLALGFLWHMLWANSILLQQLPAALEGEDIVVTGVVVSLPVPNDISQQFKFRILQSDRGFSQRLVLLNYYGDDSIRAGQHWQFLVRLNKPHGFANPASFDYEAWLFQQSIASKGYVRDSTDNQILCTQSLSVNSLRSRLRDRVQTAFAGLDHGGIILALILGDRSEISRETWQQLSDAGVNHLFVISGLHIGLIALVVFWLADKLMRLWPASMLLIPAQKIAAMLSILAALAYSFLAGFTLPTQRALIMIVVFMLAYLSSRPLAISFRYLLALTLVLTVNPLAVVSMGFWFSFAAVAALLLCVNLPARDKDETTAARARDHIIHHYVKPQLIVFVALATPLLFWTQQLPLLSPLINIFAIPLVALMVVPLCLLAVTALLINETMAQIVVAAADMILNALFLLIAGAMGLFESGAVAKFTGLSSAMLVAVGIATVLLLLPRGMPSRWLALPQSLPLWLPLPGNFDAPSLQLYFLDVGQGLAVVIQTPQHVLVYDAGANLSADFNIGSAVVAPFLNQLGVRHVDLVVISHGDNDHAGGLSGLISNTEVVAITSSASRLPQPLSSALPIAPCHEYRDWSWDEVGFRFLGRYSSAVSANDNSCVLQITVGKHRVLLPGDIERLTEYQLARRYGDELQSTILAAPHHGSKTSSSYPFLKMVNPEMVVFSSGYRNSFGHPHPEIETRYRLGGTETLHTSASGMISFTIDRQSGAIETSLYRRQQRRYWR